MTWKSQQWLVPAGGNVCVNDVFILQTLPGVSPPRASPPGETGSLWHSSWDQGVGKVKLSESLGTIQCSGAVELLRVPVL